MSRNSPLPEASSDDDEDSIHIAASLTKGTRAQRRCRQQKVNLAGIFVFQFK
jgi:hypothetical protein